VVSRLPAPPGVWGLGLSAKEAQPRATTQPLLCCATIGETWALLFWAAYHHFGLINGQEVTDKEQNLEYFNHPKHARGVKQYDNSCRLEDSLRITIITRFIDGTVGLGSMGW
jgi:hypothetical protein